MRRRDFVIALGSGVGASIAGYFAYHRWPEFAGAPVGPNALPAEACPRLKADVTCDRSGDQVTLRRGEAADAVVCAVNAAGAAIVDRLDGRHSIEEISAALAGLIPVGPGRLLEAKVALFVAQLAQCGFLADPFYVTLYELRES